MDLDRETLRRLEEPIAVTDQENLRQLETPIDEGTPLLIGNASRSG